MKTEIKKKDASPNYWLILYPDGVPSTGYTMTKQDLYAMYVELRDVFQEDTPTDTGSEESTLGLSIDDEEI